MRIIAIAALIAVAILDYWLYKECVRMEREQDDERRLDKKK